MKLAARRGTPFSANAASRSLYDARTFEGKKKKEKRKKRKRKGRQERSIQIHCVGADENDTGMRNVEGRVWEKPRRYNELCVTNWREVYIARMMKEV